MKKIAFLSLVAAMLLGGCMLYTDKPPQRNISGQVVDADSGQPVPYAVLWFYSERTYLGMSTNYGIDATAYANAGGRFTLKASLNDKVTVLIYKDGIFQAYELPPFPPTNTLDNIVWKIRQVANADGTVSVSTSMSQ